MEPKIGNHVNTKQGNDRSIRRRMKKMIVWDQSLWRKKREGIFIDNVLLF